MRYVILRHELPAGGERGSHWDLMFDVAPHAALRTWAVDAAPDAAGEQPALSLPDHRREYLAYEGPVSAGRGSVTRWDEGEFELSPTAVDSFCVRVAGRRLRGTIRLTTDRYYYEPAS